MTTTPADEFAAAVRKLRPFGQTGEPLVSVQLSPAAVERVAELLDAFAEWAREYPEMAHDHDRPACDDYACDVMGRGIALARVLTA
ncbi:hypothetical protein ACFZAR_36200 [Streptomyces sp. NPDC008222]|uniref:hypothetical protein n=1 Tax=Streptomyces sp. NPDC008222 TaxID=3364820 RepID=UPI0036E6D917